MTTQQPATQPAAPKKDAWTSFIAAVGNGIFALMGECWRTTMLVLRPLTPLLRAAESAWQAVFNPIYAAIGATKLLDSVTGTVILGFLVLGVTLLVIRLAVM
jgi:hypothetical protein